MTLQVRITHANTGYPAAAVVRQAGCPDVVVADGESTLVTLHQQNQVTVFERTAGGATPTLAAPSKFTHALGDKVRITLSGERAEVIGRAEYASAFAPQYQLRYLSAAGSAVEAWWDEGTLERA